MSIIRMVMTVTYFQFAKSETVLWNETKSTSSVTISESLQLQQNDTRIYEKSNLSKDFINLNSMSLDNLARNFTEINNMGSQVTKKKFYYRNFTTGGIYTKNGTKAETNLLHRITKHHNFQLENHPQVPFNEKTAVSTEGKSSSGENDTSVDIQIFLILSIFIVMLILGYTMYTRRSYISIPINRDRDYSNKTEKKLRYHEVATEGQSMDITNTASCRRTILSKIGLSSCKSNSPNDSTNPISEVVQISDTPSTHSSNKLDELDEENMAMMKSAIGSRTRDFHKRTCCTINTGYDESLDTSKVMCPKCNHYRDPQMIIKRINEVERKGSRIFIPIRLPVTFGSGKIKSMGFPKLLGNHSNTTRTCSPTIQSNYTSSSSSSCQRSEKRHAASGSSGGTSKSNDISLSLSGSQQHENAQCHSVSGSSTSKSKSNSDCSSSITAITSRSTTKSKGYSNCSSIAATSEQVKDNQCCVASRTTTTKSKASSDCMSSTSSCSGEHKNEQSNGSASSKASTIDHKSCSKSQKSYKQKPSESIKTSALSTYSSQPEVCCSSTVAFTLDDETSTSSPSTITRWLSSENTTTCTANSQSQNEVHHKSIISTERTHHDAVDDTSKNSASSYGASGMEICEHYSDEEDCQYVFPGHKNKNSSAGCSTRISISSISSTIKCIADSHEIRADHAADFDSDEMKSESNSDFLSHTSKSATKKSKQTNGDFVVPEISCEKSSQRGQKNTETTQLSTDSSISSNTPFKTPVKFKVLSTDPNYNPSTLQVKQQLKMLLQQDSNPKEQSYQLNKNKLQPGQVIYADLCFVKQDVIKCANSNLSKKSTQSKNSETALSACSNNTKKNGNITSESESDAGYGPSQTESCESEDTNGHCDKNNQNSSTDEMDDCYKQCVSKICHDEYPRSSFTKKIGSGFGRRASVDTTLKSSLSSDSRGNFIQSLNQRLKGTYLNQTKGSSNRSVFSSTSRFSSSSRCTPVFEYAADDDCDVYEPLERHLESSNRSTRSSINNLLPKIRSYMSRRKKCSFSDIEQVYTDPSGDERTTELCENCLKYVPKDISKTIRSRQSTYSEVDRFKNGGTVHLNDLIEVYPNLYPKLPFHIREALYKGMDDYSGTQYRNLCDNYDRVRDSKCSELSSSFENINCIN